MLTFPLRNAKTILKKQMIGSKPPSDKRAGSLFVCLSVCLCSSCVIETNAAESNIIIAGFALSIFYILLVITLCLYYLLA